MRLIGYLRVSTDRQAERGLGLDVQESAIKAWAKANGSKLVGMATDKGVSGSNGIDDREALPSALEWLATGKADGIVVYRLDRLARDLILQEQLLAEVRRLGGDVFTTMDGEAAYLTDDPDDPSRKLIRQVLGAVAEYEKSMVVSRMRAGRQRKAALGGYAYGSPPYGWQSVNGELEPLAHEQDVIARIRKLHADDTPMAVIARTLNEEGVPARKSRWYTQTVKRVIERETQ